MNTFKNCLWKLGVVAVVLMMVISGISNARSVYAVGENTQQTIVNQNETAPQTSEESTQKNAKEGVSDTSVSASENEKVEEKTDADQSTGLDPPATTENKTDAVEMPEASFTASTDKLIISVTALANTFPKGTKMEAKEISASDAKSIAKEKMNNIGEVIGVDITFTYEGKEIEPANDKNVTVKMTLKNEMQGKNFQVLHKKDSGDIEKMKADISAKKAVFKTNSFSIYVFAENQVDTYIFYDGFGKPMSTYTQKITSGEELTKPNAPEKDGYKFIGWSTSENATEADFDFDKLPAVNGSTRNIYAVFKEVHYVFFMAGVDDDNVKKVASTKEGIKGNVISAEEISQVKLGLASNQSIEGWYEDPALTKKVDSITIGDKNISLYPNIQSGHHITFDSDGGTYIEPRFVNAEATVEEENMPEPKKKGYNFQYWSTSKDGEKYKYGNILNDDLKLYAVYEAANTDYSVVYWIESTDDAVDKYGNVENKTYVVQDTDKRTAKTNTLVSITTADKNKYTKGVTYNAGKTETKKILSADGNTVLNVYFDRNVININFHYGGDVYFSYRYEEYYAYGYNNLQSYYGLYGAKFNDWPKTGRYLYFEDGTVDRGSVNYLSFLDSYILPDPSKKVIHLYETKNKGERTVNFMLETLQDGQYKLDKTYNTSISTFQITDKYNGFTAVSYQKDYNLTKSLPKNPNSEGVYETVTNYGKLIINFKRNSYNLMFHNYNGLDKTLLVKYEASLSDKYYIPSRPEGLDEEYTFAGWYKDEAYTAKFNFNSTMPAHGIKLYAKWVAHDVNVTVHGLDKDETQSISNLPFRSKIDIDELPTVIGSDGKVIVDGDDNYTYTVPSGSHWVGWATKDNNDNYTLFNFDTELKKNLHLYPYVIDSNKYVVSYVVNGDTDTVTDDKKYALNSFADVKSAKGLEAPSGSMFLNWQLYLQNGDGKFIPKNYYYYPGDKVKITGNIQLVAKYVPIPQKVSLVYHANNGTDTPVRMHTVNGNPQLDNNDKIILYDGKTFEAPTNSEGVKAVFDSWNTKDDGSGTSFKAGQEVRINKIDTNNTGTNNLYAQWKYVADLKISNSVTGNQGDKTKYFAFNVVIKNVKADAEYSLENNATYPDNPSKVKSNANGEITTTVYLKNGESIIFKDVNITNKDATYQVSETNGTGYTTTYKLDGDETSGVDTFTNGFQKNHTVAFTNTLNGSVPTGIQKNTIITFPLIIAGIGFVLRMFKNRNDEE